jgi:hypothetical protein
MDEHWLLSRLQILEREGVKPREVLALHQVITRPGICGTDICNSLGVVNRSAIDSNLRRLQAFGFMEDRRRIHVKAAPSSYHVLPKGRDFYDRVMGFDL